MGLNGAASFKGKPRRVLNVKADREDDDLGKSASLPRALDVSLPSVNRSGRRVAVEDGPPPPYEGSSVRVLEGGSPTSLVPSSWVGGFGPAVEGSGCERSLESDHVLVHGVGASVVSGSRKFVMCVEISLTFKEVSVSAQDELACCASRMVPRSKVEQMVGVPVAEGLDDDDILKLLRYPGGAQDHVGFCVALVCLG